MKKDEFLSKLNKGLSKFSEVEINKVTTYYEEIIMDRLEEHEKESDIIASFGTIDSIIKKVSMEIVEKRVDNDNSSHHVISNFFAIIGLGLIS